MGFLYDIFVKPNAPNAILDPERKKHHMPNSITLIRIMIIFQSIKYLHHYFI